MKPFTVLILAVVGLFIGGSFFLALAQVNRIEKIAVVDPDQILKGGQGLEYSIEWLGFPVGRVIIKNIGLTNLKGRPCYLVVARSFPNRFIRRLYDLEYKVYSFIDAENFSSCRFFKIRRFGKQSNYTLIDFDHKNKKATCRSWGLAKFVKISKKNTESLEPKPTQEIDEDIQDLLSAFFYIRLNSRKENSQFEIKVYYQQANWSLTVNTGQVFLREIKGKGSFPAIEVTVSSGLNEYILGRRKFLVTLTTESRRVPLEFKIGTSLGFIRAIIRRLPD